MATLTGRAIAMLTRSTAQQPKKLLPNQRERLLDQISNDYFPFRTVTVQATPSSSSPSSSTSSPFPTLDLESAGKLISTSVNDFDIRNLMKGETIISSFTLNKVSALKSSLNSAQHPIVNVAHEIFEDSETKWINSLGGFTLLFLGKTLQSVPAFRFNQETWNKQRILAECYEILDKGMLIHHSSIVNIPSSSSSANEDKLNDTLNKCNKLAVLGGDYLLALALVRLASLVRRANVFDFIGASLDEFCINHFDNHQRNNVQTNWVLPKSSENSIETWEKYGGYCTPKLAAYTCQFMAIMSELSSIRYEQAAYNFGYNLKLMWNIQDDIRGFTEGKPKHGNPISAPIMKYIEREPSFIDFLNKNDLGKDETMKEVREIILKSDVIDECQSLSKYYSEKCVKNLEIFPDCPSRLVLESIARGNVSQ